MMSYAHAHDETFFNEDMWKIKNVLDSMWPTRRVLGIHYEKSGLRRIASNNKKIEDYEPDTLHELLSKY